MTWTKIFFVLLMVVPLNSCINIYEIHDLSYNREMHDNADTPITHNDIPSTDCYSETIRIIETNFPAKPELKDDEEISKALLDSLQAHRQFIRESISEMKKCRK